MIECCLKEAMRLYPPVQLTLRQTTQSDVLGGYYIPSGTTIALQVRTSSLSLNLILYSAVSACTCLAELVGVSGRWRKGVPFFQSHTIPTLL